MKQFQKNYYIIKEEFNLKNIIIVVIFITNYNYFYFQYTFINKYYFQFIIISSYMIKFIKIYWLKFICNNVYSFTLSKTHKLGGCNFILL